MFVRDFVLSSSSFSLGFVVSSDAMEAEKNKGKLTALNDRRDI